MWGKPTRSSNQHGSFDPVDELTNAGASDELAKHIVNDINDKRIYLFIVDNKLCISKWAGNTTTDP